MSCRTPASIPSISVGRVKQTSSWEVTTLPSVTVQTVSSLSLTISAPELSFTFRLSNYPEPTEPLHEDMALRAYTYTFDIGL